MYKNYQNLGKLFLGKQYDSPSWLVDQLVIGQEVLFAEFTIG